MTARIIALSVLMAELCSTPPPLAATPVALSLSNATDYVSSIPVNTNLIKGIGMGAGGAYTTLRAEDTEFLVSATVERFHFASHSGDAFTDLGAIDCYVGRIPSRLVDGYPSALMISNSYPVTWDDRDRLGVPVSYGRHGFVPPDFDLWMDYQRSESTNGWFRAGYDAAEDIRAIFLPESRAFSPEELAPAYALTNLFAGVPNVQVLTNAYATIASDLCSTILASATIATGAYPAYLSRCTNRYETAFDSVEVSNITYATYSYGGRQQQYATGYTLYPRQSGSASGVLPQGSDMSCYKERIVTYHTPYSVRQTGQTTGEYKPLPPYKSDDQVSLSSPGSGGPWSIVFAVVAGTAPGGGPGVHPQYNTNIITRAYLVSLWECVTARREIRSTTSFLPAYSFATSSVVRAITSYPIGQIVPVAGNAAHSNDLWQTSGEYEGFGTGVADVQKAFYEVASGYFDKPFADVDISDPLIVRPEDFPPVATNDLAAAYRTVYAQTLYSHTLRSVKSYVVMLVTPTYYARVLDDY